MEMTLGELLGLLSMDSRFKPGNVAFRTGAFVQIVAAATSVTLFTLGTSRSAWLLGLFVFNAATSSVNLTLSGTGTFSQRLPDIGPLLTNFHDIIWITPTEFTTNIVIRSDAAAASPNEVRVSAFVAETI